jgi:hypothetical protein
MRESINYQVNPLRRSHLAGVNTSRSAPSQGEHKQPEKTYLIINVMVSKVFYLVVTGEVWTVDTS